jgi:hypothetical protein
LEFFSIRSAIGPLSTVRRLNRFHVVHKIFLFLNYFSMQTVLLTLIGPTRQIDLRLPAEIPIGDLLPILLELCGPDDPEHASVNTQPSWGLVFPANSAVLPPARSLRACGVVDGAILLLQDAAAFAAQQRQADDPSFRPQALLPSAETGGIGVRWNVPER